MTRALQLVKERERLKSGILPTFLLLAGLLVGTLMTAQISSRRAAQQASRSYTGDITAQTALAVRVEQQELRRQLQELRAQLSGMQKEAASHQGNLQELQRDLESHRQLVGLTALQGPGVLVTLDDSKADVPPDTPNLNRYVIHQQQLVLVIGVLWSSGAEAIAINDQRITDQSSIYCVGSTIVVNQALLSPPFDVRAIGDPGTLAAAVQSSPLLEELWTLRREYGINVNLQQQEQLVVPAYTGHLALQHIDEQESRLPERKQ